MNSENDKIKNIQRAIVETIVFFDLFDFPMTDFEVWQNVRIKCEYQEIRDELNKNIRYLETKNGFWFLKNRFFIIKTRMRRYNYTDKKFKRALKVSRVYKYIPWIRMIGIGNIIGAHNLKKEGDIDFFIITEKNRIWITRFFCVLVVKFLNLRPKLGNTKDKICLSFYMSEEKLSLKDLMIKSSDLDFYFVYWLAGLVPIYDKNSTYKKLVSSNNWIKEILPNLSMKDGHYLREVKNKDSIFYRNVIDMLVGGLEKGFQKLSMKILPSNIKNIMNKSDGVIVNNHVLKFHLNDRRREFLQKFKLKLKELYING
jgi:hypothetical protein